MLDQCSTAVLTGKWIKQLPLYVSKSQGLFTEDTDHTLCDPVLSRIFYLCFYDGMLIHIAVSLSFLGQAERDLCKLHQVQIVKQKQRIKFFYIIHIQYSADWMSYVSKGYTRLFSLFPSQCTRLTLPAGSNKPLPNLRTRMTRW